MYTSHFFGEAPERWGYGPIVAERKKIDTLLQVVKLLVDANVMGVEVITAFHERRVLPLMRRARHLDEMVLNTPLEGTVLVIGELDREEIKKCIKSVLGSVPSDVVLDAHRPMRPDDDFINMVSAPHSSSTPPFLWPLCVPFFLTQGLGGHRGISAWSPTSTHPFPRMQSRGRGTGLTPRGEEAKGRRE
jgi:hypothetical protein